MPDDDLRDTGEHTWDYEFSVWPVQGREQALYDILNFNWRIHRTFTETAWSVYRAELEREGLMLKEVTRTPHHEPEVVL